ncbi:hypothetical protein JQN58_01715 [Aneurinibacillus sp. BA2021]|nr:hypothetical protein [Aneurinibacillus sp. BA2021]
MISINIYDLVKSEGKELATFHHEEKEIINDFEEKLETYIMTNNVTPTGYQNFRVITDEVYNQTVRVKGEVVRQVIMQETYQAYYKQFNQREDGVGSLVTLCKKDDSYKVKEIVEKNFNMQFEQHSFDILKIIDAATDVRNARFSVKIETVNSVSMGGTRVHDTQYYAQMLRQGDLKAVIIAYDLPHQSVTLRISVEGSILLYSQLSDNEILDLVEDLLNI